jgi:hypothetical protein
MPLISMKPRILVALLAGLALLASGCASPNVNPPHARAGTGYVDFYADIDGGVAWDVQCFDDAAGQFKEVFSDVEVPEGEVLRLAFAPGTRRLRVSCLDNVIQTPADISVTVIDGQIVPVEVTLIPVGAAQVKSQSRQVGKTYLGPRRRHTDYDYSKTQIYNVTAEPQDPLAYQPRQKMPYYESPAN